MRKLLYSISLFALVFGFAACSNMDDEMSNNGNNSSIPILKVTSEGVSSMDVNNVKSVLSVTNQLAANEAEFLYAIRQEEKLSRDLALAFAAKYPSEFQFSRIAVAEGTHILAIERVLDYYEITYPALEQAGVFSDPQRQADYNQLLEKGTSSIEAYKVLAIIEEENVAAFANIKPSITNENLKLVIDQLNRASSNHLRMLVRLITYSGGTYTPTILDQTTFDSIINSSFGQGGMCQFQGQGNTNSQKGRFGQGNKGNVNGMGNWTGGNGNTGGMGNGNTGGTGNGVGKGYHGGRCRS